jgi:hypothetical protein
MPKVSASSEKQQLGVRVVRSLVDETKILAIRQHRPLNDLVEEALRDLLKKHRAQSRA